MQHQAQDILVSVIIPAYNAEKYLEETVASALASTYQNFEIIIVNDGSADQTQSVGERIASSNPKVSFISQPNQGVAVARNRAISQAHGEYIFPLDADDLISPTYIEQAVQALANQPEVKVVYGKAVRFGDQNKTWNLPPFSRRLLARKNMIYVSALFRKYDYDQTDGYRPEIKGPEDWDFWISLLKRDGEVVCLPEVCFYYRIHSVSKRKSTRNKKKEAIDIMNTRHKAFFYRELGGRLRYSRTWSRFLNFMEHLVKCETFVVNPSFSQLDEVVYQVEDAATTDESPFLLNHNGTTITVHQFHYHSWLHLFFSPKLAQKAYQKDIDSNPSSSPIGYYEQKALFRFPKSYYLCILNKV